MAVAATSPVRLGHVDPRREVVLELVDEHEPLMLVRWSGQVKAQHVLQMMRFFDNKSIEAHRDDTRLVFILDARDAALPGSLVRDMLADWLSDRPKGGTILSTIVVAPDPLIRGVIISLKWATGRGDGIKIVPTVAQAIDIAKRRFSMAGIPVPEVLDEEED